MTQETASDRGQQDTVVIHIDRAQFRVREGAMTGAELRNLPQPDIGPELDLWQEVPGGQDILIANDQSVRLRNGMHFFTAPGRINPGV